MRWRAGRGPAHPARLLDRVRRPDNTDVVKHAWRIGVCAAVVSCASLVGLVAQHGHASATGPDAASAAGPTSAPNTVTAQRPILAVVGASISDGVGASKPDDAWPQVLAQQLGWQSEVSADPGAGYIALGRHRLGPMLKLLAKLQLHEHHPTMVIVQSGYNDIGMPTAELAASVHKVIGEIQTQAPDAALGVMTVFPKGQPSSAAWATDETIVAAARATDPHVYVFDPLTSHWVFPTVPDRLHPTSAGHRWIADKLADDFRHDGLTRGLTH
jgi:acyl-CoA thioesterase I